MRKPSETGLVRQVLDYLNHVRRYPAFRLNTGGLRDAARRLVRFGSPGMSDIVCLAPEVSVWIECKMPGKQLTALQKAFGDVVRTAGHVYCCVRSLDELIAVLEEIEA